MGRRRVRTEEHAGFGDDGLDMHGGLLCLCGDIAAGGDDDEGVCLAVRVLDVETAEEHGGGGDGTLSELEFLSEFRDDCGKGREGRE